MRALRLSVYLEFVLEAVEAVRQNGHMLRALRLNVYLEFVLEAVKADRKDVAPCTCDFACAGP